MLRRKKKTDDMDRFFQIFAGELVRVYTKTKIKESIATEQGEVTQETPLIVAGYLLDFDNKYYYLGDEPDQATTAVAIDQVVLIQELVEEKQKDIYDMMMDQADPKKVM